VPAPGDHAKPLHLGIVEHSRRAAGDLRQPGFERKPRPQPGVEMRRGEHQPVAHHAGEANRHAIGLRQLRDQDLQRGEQAVGRGRIGRRHPGARHHHISLGVEDRGLQPGAANIDGQGERMRALLRGLGRCLLRVHAAILRWTWPSGKLNLL